MITTITTSVSLGAPTISTSVAPTGYHSHALHAWGPHPRFIRHLLCAICGAVLPARHLAYALRHGGGTLALSG